MFRKTKSYLVLTLFLFIFVSYVYGVEVVDKSAVNNGIIKINYVTAAGETVRVVIEKDGISNNYIINNGPNVFPLQLGSGNYKITLAEHLADKKYKVLLQETVNYNPSNPNIVYLQSIQTINWNVNMEVIKKAKELTKEAKTDLEKVNLIYAYVTNNIKYDYSKQKTVNVDYIPSIEQAYNTKSGICYDYASLTAGMLRSVGVPTKLVKGNNKDIAEYHAWNQVYLAETNSWKIIDTTYDSIYTANNQAVNMLKDASHYTVKKEY